MPESLASRNTSPSTAQLPAATPRGRAGRLRSAAQSLLARADVQIDGSRDTDIQVHDDRVFQRVFAHGSLGFGESYMDGDWDVRDLPGLMRRLLSARLDEQLHNLGTLALWAQARFINMQRGKRAYVVGKRHYDLGNDLFAAMLGQRLVYSCGYWAEAHDLNAAQEAKLDLVCRKLRLRPGMRVLDIGCGWGEALKFAAERYGVRGVGVTISREQAAFARDLCRGLPVEIRLQDYRELDEPFDAIFSIGMFEHVAHATTSSTSTWCAAAWLQAVFPCCTPSAATRYPTTRTRGSSATSSRTPRCHR